MTIELFTPLIEFLAFASFVGIVFGLIAVLFRSKI